MAVHKIFEVEDGVIELECGAVVMVRDEDDKTETTEDWNETTCATCLRREL